jgi:glycosyltransferase involved in cell wall biosynthesis
MSLNIGIINPVLSTPYVLPPFIVGQARSIPASELPDVNIVELGRALGNLGHHVTIYAADAFLESDQVAVNDRVTICGVPAHLRWIFNPALVAFTPGLAYSPRLREADIIQSGEFHQLTTYFASRLAADAGIPLVVWQETFHHMRLPGQWYEQCYEFTAGRSVRATARRFILRTRKAQAYLEALGIPRSFIGPWVPTGIDGMSFQPRSGTLHPEDFGMPNDCALATIVARLDPDKGVDVAIRAISLLTRKGMKVGLLVRGSGPELNRLRTLAKQEGVKDRVRFLSRKSRAEMAELYNSSDIVVLASRKDLFPFSLLEAAACGRPIVATRVGCVDDLVEDGVNGILTTPDSVEAFAAGIHRILSDDDFREAAGKATRQRFEEDFDIRVTAGRLAKVYQETLSGGTAPTEVGGDRNP